MCNARVWTFPEARFEEVSTRILSIPEVPINVGALNSKFLCKSDICLFLWANRKILGVVFFCCHIMCCDYDVTKHFQQQYILVFVCETFHLLINLFIVCRLRQWHLWYYRHVQPPIKAQV